MLCSGLILRCLTSLLGTLACLGLAKAQTIDEIIEGTSSEITHFDFMIDKNGTVRVELDMMMTVQQYLALFSHPDVSILNKESSASFRPKRKAISSAHQRWTNKQIPYTIDRSTFSDAQTREIMNAIEEWQTLTCVRFRPASKGDLNFVTFVDGTSCGSWVGMKEGINPITLPKRCRNKGVISHEIGHTVGFFHEQNRPDRDAYITIHAENINSRYVLHNFQKYLPSAVFTYGVPYDYESLMHYGGRYFSKNGQHTIRTKDPAYQGTIGNRKYLSFNDIKLANLMYQCNDTCDEHIVCPGDGFVGQDCKCVCRGKPVQICYESETRTTRPKVKTTGTSPTCKDMNGRCDAWAVAGYCRTNNYVRTYCQKSCFFCNDEKPLLPECKDMMSHCAIWSKQGFCGNTVYTVFMTDKCPVSCGVCKINIHLDTSGNNGQHMASSSLLLLLVSLFGCFARFV